MESAARSLLTCIVGETFEVEEKIARRAAALLVKALDTAGLVIMPIEPTAELGGPVAAEPKMHFS